MAGLVGLWWSERYDGPALGDRGEVTAVVSPDCQALDISVDGLTFMAQSGLPPEWRGSRVRGNLVLTGPGSSGASEPSDDVVEGIFTATDGRQATVFGGEPGYGFLPACGIWPPDQ